MTDAAFSALASLADPSLLIMLVVGVLAGLVIGLIPGLGGTGAVAILLPVTFGMDPEPALAMLIGALAVVHTSDTVAAVLLGAPGSASASVTMLDGYSMARRGQAKRALSLAFLSSMAGGLIGAVGLTLAIPLARPLVLSFGSPELFMLTILGVSLAAVLSRGNVVKGLTAGFLGLLLGLVGSSPTTAEERFSFGSLFLSDGVSLVAVALGVFGLAEIASRVGQRKVTEEPVTLTGGWASGIREWLTHWTQVVRGALIGIWAGVLPGVGATAGTWLAYGQAVATAKDKRKFGKGDPRGIVGPESANNSVEAGDLIPTFLFGIPGGVPSAMLLGMLLTYGIQPGPSIVSEHLDLMYLIIWAFAIASVAGAFLCFLATGSLARLTKVPFAVLGPGLLVVMLLGAFQEGGQLGDLWVMVALGVVGFFLKATGMPRAPFLIGFVLAIPMERYYYLTTNLYDGAGWMTRPGVLAFAAVLVLPVLWSLLRKARTATGRADDGHRDEHPVEERAEVDLEGSMAGTPWSLGVAAVAAAVFAGALWMSGSFSEEAALMPRLVAVGGLVAAGLLLWQELRPRFQPQADPEPTVHDEAPSGGSTLVATRVEQRTVAQEARAAVRNRDLAIGARTFAAMATFLVLVMVGGYLAATLVFTPVFLLYVARTRPRTAVVYTLVLGLVLLSLPSLLPVELPLGALQ